MLVRFKTKNYKSFAEEIEFSMVAAPKQQGLDYSLFRKKIKGKQIKGLCSSVIYGPNAAGKTSIIGAMQVFRSIVLRGNIKNSEERSSPNLATSVLELIPNNEFTNPQPVEFSIDFVEDDLLIHYGVCIDLGLFLDGKHERKILSEELSVNGKVVFIRKQQVEYGDLRVIKQYLSESIEQNKCTVDDTVKEIVNNSLDDSELFLTNGFRVIISPSIVNLTTKWFQSKLLIVYRADSVRVEPSFSQKKKDRTKTAKLDGVLADAIREFGSGANELGYISDEEGTKSILYSIVGKTAINAEMFESYGTIRFVNLLQIIFDAMREGATLIIDEFDASLHPMALMSVINVFHNDDVNIHGAQLIFNTHNPIFLNSTLFRRDEIKFVERDEANRCSSLYSLSDFRTTGEANARKHGDYMKNYFISKYGAIKDIDFTPLFEEVMRKNGEGSVAE